MADLLPDESFFGHHSEKNGVTYGMIFNGPKGTTKVNLTNGLVHEIRSYLQSDEKAADSIKLLCRDDECNGESLRKKVCRTYHKIKDMKKAGLKKKMEEYSEKQFSIPMSSSNDANLSEHQASVVSKIQEKTKEVVTENRGLKREIIESREEIEKLENLVDCLEDRLEGCLFVMSNIQNKYRETLGKYAKDKELLLKETNQCSEKYSEMSKKLDETAQELNETKEKLSKYRTRNVNKRHKRLSSKYEDSLRNNIELSERVGNLEKELRERKNDLEEGKKESEKDKESLAKSEGKVQELKVEKHKLQKKISALLRREKKAGKCNEVLENEEKIECLKEEVRDCNVRIRELEQLNELLESDIVKTFENGKYTPLVRECIMTLLTECNVSLNKVNVVIETVLRNLTGKLPDRLPSLAVRSRLYVEAKAVAQQQIVKAMLNNVNPADLVGNTLHSDATSKFFKHYQGFQITTREGQSLSIGLSELGASDSASVMESFTSLMKELVITMSSDEVEQEQKVKQLITSITNTMSDQGAVNPVFNRMLADLRSEFLPSVINNWDNLSAEVREQIKTMGNFFCKMHLIVNFASESEKCLKEFEVSIIETGKNPHSFGYSESSAVRLVRTAAKAFTSHGSEKAGVSSYWESFLGEKGMKNELVTFRSNRFNIIFLDSAALYYHWNDCVEFLNQWLSPNDLLKSIEYDLNQKITKAGVRALGIVDKVITGPLWRLFESDRSILELNPYLKHALDKLNRWASDSSAIFEGDFLFPDINIHADHLHDALFAETNDLELDTLTQMCLEIIINAILIILDRQAKDQLPDGKYYDVSENFKMQASSVPMTNTISERDFGILDLLVRMKPAGSVVCYESITLWSNNKTSAWLQGLPENEREDIMEMARKRAPSLKQKILERKFKIKEQKLAQLKEKQSKKQKKDDCVRESKVRLTNEISSLGGVWSASDIDSRLREVKDSGQDLEHAILVQIKFHKDVLLSRGPRELFQRSKSRKKYSLDELKSNLLQILGLNQECVDTSENTKNLKLKPLQTVQEHLREKKLSVVNKIEAARQKRIKQQQIELLPFYLENPSGLVDKRVKHQCYDQNQNPIWYNAKVKSLSKPCENNPLKTKYIIEYELEGEDDCEFDLLYDLKKGDLIIL